jgi:HEAT repeat protein
MSVLSVCVLALLPQIFERKDRVVLPKPQPPPAQQPAAPVVDEAAERLRRLVFDLRRSAGLSPGAEEAKLREIAETVPQPGVVARKLLLRAEQELMHGLIKVLQRYGDADAAADIQYVLLTRAVGAATPLALQTMVELAPELAKPRLFECLGSRFRPVQNAAAELLAQQVGEADLPQLLQLCDATNAEVARRALELLALVPGDTSRARLLQALGDVSPTTAATACRGLFAHGPRVAPPLQQIVEQAATGRSFGFATLLLTQFEDQTGEIYLTPAMVPHLLRELDGLDPFLQVTSALALANLAFRSDDRTGQPFADRKIVDALLLIAAPRAFVPNGSLLDEPVAQKLVQFTGADHRGRATAWLDWWKQSSEGFLGRRLRIPLDATRAAVARLEWRDPERIVRIRGIDAPAGPALPRESRPLWELFATGDELAALVGRLERLGFMTQGMLAAAMSTQMLPRERELELSHGVSVASVAGPRMSARWLDALQTELAAFADKEKWQLFLPGGEDRRARWQAEREWLAANPDRMTRDRRLKDAVLAALPELPDSIRDLGLQVLQGIPAPEQVFTPADAERLAGLVRARQKIDAPAQEMLELLLRCGPDTWRLALDVTVELHAQGGEAALPQLFALLGDQKVLAAAADGAPATRKAAMRELANSKDLRGTPILVAALADEALAETAVFALGRIADPAAREPLLQLLERDGLAGGLRRTAWIALARIGGEKVVPVLQDALSFPDFLDRQAALQAMGELRDAGIAAFLAQVFATWGTDALGSQALLSLQKQGALLARPALRRFLDNPDPRVRREIVLALAELQDPTVVPDLISLLDAPMDGARAAMLLASITGVDVPQLNDRVAYMREWWRLNREQPQAAWFLTALREQKIETTLAPELLVPGAGVRAVPELTSVLVKATQPHLRVLAAAMLRETTERDFGQVTPRTPPVQLQAIADRYQYFAEAEGSRR